MRKGHELGSRQPGWTHPSWIWVFQTQARAALDLKLTAVLRGDASPAGAGEHAAMAELCLMHRKRYATALRFYTAAFATGPKLAEDLAANHRYNAACAAALAADGKGLDADELKGEARTAARRPALDWLRADLKARADLHERKPAESKSVAIALEHWRSDPDLASVRDTAALAKLPPGEKDAWEKLWAEVAMLRQQAVKRIQ
jgi:eukaryotic-like serine/threonine-protein kinase